jgi:hypothetical protein
VLPFLDGIRHVCRDEEAFPVQTLDHNTHIIIPLGAIKQIYTRIVTASTNPVRAGERLLDILFPACNFGVFQQQKLPIGFRRANGEAQRGRDRELGHELVDTGESEKVKRGGKREKMC